MTRRIRCGATAPTIIRVETNDKTMPDLLIDNPLILSMLFHPRRATAGDSTKPNTYDGIITTNGAELGYRLYKAAANALLLYFHGNGEVAADYDGMATLFQETGTSLLLLDYRGYGWSTGKPLGSTLLPDAEAAFKGLPAVLAAHGIPADTPLFIMGRSLGSAPAVHLAATFPDAFKGLILDSAFAHTPSLLITLGIPKALLANLPDPFANERKIASVPIPTLIIHGARDTLIPIEHGERLYEASPAAKKTLLRIPGAGHNDLLFYGIQPYFAAVKKLINGE
ncbi:MAG: alpha/beta hydrolase [Anaerolineae bacterium]